MSLMAPPTSRTHCELPALAPTLAVPPWQLLRFLSPPPHSLFEFSALASQSFVMHPNRPLSLSPSGLARGFPSARSTLLPPIPVKLLPAPFSCLRPPWRHPLLLEAPWGWVVPSLHAHLNQSLHCFPLLNVTPSTAKAPARYTPGFLRCDSSSCLPGLRLKVSKNSAGRPGLDVVMG